MTSPMFNVTKTASLIIDIWPQFVIRRELGPLQLGRPDYHANLNMIENYPATVEFPF
jgi:hypothetical protein